MQYTKLKKKPVQGFTIIELSVAALISLSVLGTALGMMVEQRRWILGDQTRQTANDSLRLTADLIGQDIKSAGELLVSDTFLPGISVIPGSTATAPDTLVVQRLLTAGSLSVCQNIGAGTSSIDVAVVNGTINGTSYGAPVPNCTYSPSNPTATSLSISSSLTPWQSIRTASNGSVAWAYIYQPPVVTATSTTPGYGEFFQYSGEATGSCSVTSFTGPPTTRTCSKIQRVGSTWKYGYNYNPAGPASDPTQPRIYFLEERRYSTIADPNTPNSYTLQLTINRQTPLRIANNIKNFQVWAKVPKDYTSQSSWGCAAGGSDSTAPNPQYPTQWYCTAFNLNLTSTFTNPILREQYIRDWQELQGIRVTLSEINPSTDLLKVDTSQTNNSLSLSSEFFPRNVLSKS